MRFAFRAILLALTLVTARAAEVPQPGVPHFMGAPSCQSSSCHGGGVGRDQSLVFTRKDVHTRAHSILGTARSLRIAEALAIPDAAKDARCTVCHSPLEAVPPLRFAAGVKAERGVSCETCHGPAESWLRFHARTDVTHEQRVGAGMREVRDLHGRANACIACHLNIDSELVRAGHPEMFFELDGQMRAQPPHWTERAGGAWLGPRAWLTGQAAALRELTWKLSRRPDDLLAPRASALRWLLSKTAPGSSQLPAGDTADFKSLQAAADRLARAASRLDWTRENTDATLRRLAESHLEFRDIATPPVEQRRRAEVLMLAVDRLWQALKSNGAQSSANFDTAFAAALGEARAQEAFQPERFAAALQQVEVALELMPK